MKKKKEMLNPVEKEILIKSLYLWQDAFVKEIKSIEKKGNISMFHPNWTNIMLREFALKFDIDDGSRIDTDADEFVLQRQALHNRAAPIVG